MDSKTTLSSDIVPIDSAASINLNDLPQEIKDMIYEDIHQQEDVKTIGQLIIRYTLPPARLQRVGKEFAAEFNRRLPRDQIHRLEITQKNMMFLSQNQSYRLPERMFPRHEDEVLVTNFNIHDYSDLEARRRVCKLLHWIDSLVHEWDFGRDLSATSAKTALPVTLRFWFCSTDVLNDFLPEFDVIWDLHQPLRALGKVEIIFYEREDHIAYPNETAVAGAKTIQVWTEADGWKLDDQAIKLARQVSKGRMYHKVDPEATDLRDKSFYEEDEGEDEDQSVDSDGESLMGYEYSDEESEDSEESEGSDGSGESEESDESGEFEQSEEFEEIEEFEESEESEESDG
jgi:hypothetical protein